MIHAQNAKNKIIFEEILAFMPLLVFAIYKNGFLLYQKNLIGLKEIFMPCSLVLISLIIYEIGYLIFNRKFGYDYDIIHFLLIALVMPPHVHLLVCTFSLIGCFLLFKLLKKIPFNHIAFMKLLIMGLFYYLNNYNYLNALEQNFHYDYNILDKLMGFQAGGLASTSIIISLLIFAFLVYRKNIKTEIVLSSISTFYICLGIVMAFQKDFNINYLINANIIFPLLFVASENLSSPNRKKGMYLYGIIIGVLTIVFIKVINAYEGAYLAILIASFGQNLYEIEKKRPKLAKNARKNKGNRL